MMDMMALALYVKIDVEKSRALDNVGDHIIITCNKFFTLKKETRTGIRSWTFEQVNGFTSPYKWSSYKLAKT